MVAYSRHIGSEKFASHILSENECLCSTLTNQDFNDHSIWSFSGYNPRALHPMDLGAMFQATPQLYLSYSATSSYLHTQALNRFRDLYHMALCTSHLIQ